MHKAHYNHCAALLKQDNFEDMDTVVFPIEKIRTIDL
jgi:hypothetical protein